MEDGAHDPELGDDLVPIARADLAAQPLPPFERLVAARIDGRRSIDELVTRCAAPRSRVRSAIARLVEIGLVAVQRPGD